MKALKRQIDALAKHLRSGWFRQSEADALQSQQETIQKNLEAASAKFAAAQLGEAARKSARSRKKLEVIEQPTVPQEPVKPNRPEIIALKLVTAAR